VSVVWWRRANQIQKPNDHIDKETHEFISSEWRFALSSIWQSDFRGIWVNLPAADIRATAKTVQLRTAEACGLRVPETLISNTPELVHQFSDRFPNGIVVKKIAGVAGKSLATVAVQKDRLIDDEIRLCPAVYQEKIKADFHLRVLAFGSDIVALRFKSDQLDWRRNLHLKVEAHCLDREICNSIEALLTELGLEMGVLDFILSPFGEYYFLEINPQGQFLFFEQLGNIDLTGRCAEFFANLFKGNTELRARQKNASRCP
jgi:glutathione synthase/RimK-type ligase-like ATP-grasp enzyme